MNIHQDFKELLELLTGFEVDYMIIGGYAVAFHGHPRFTKDLGIFFDYASENIERIIKALEKFGFPRESLVSAPFANGNKIVTFGVPPLRVDFINQIDGVSFSQAKPGRVLGSYGGVGVYFIGREDLIKNKLATGRTRDKADVEELS